MRPTGCGKSNASKGYFPKLIGIPANLRIQPKFVWLPITRRPIEVASEADYFVLRYVQAMAGRRIPRVEAVGGSSDNDKWPIAPDEPTALTAVHREHAQHAWSEHKISALQTRKVEADHRLILLATQAPIYIRTSIRHSIWAPSSVIQVCAPRSMGYQTS